MARVELAQVRGAIERGQVTAVRIHADGARASARIQLRGRASHLTDEVSFVERVEPAGEAARRRSA